MFVEEFLIPLGLLVLVVGGAWGILFILRAVLLSYAKDSPWRTNPPAGNPAGNRDSTRDLMDQGDYHSGPGGYEPNTAYPDTHYGELGDDR